MTNITKTSEKDTTQTKEEKATTTAPISYKYSEEEDLAMSLFY
ncbi:hypothetical protein [uncultured Flavobacterium sp.]|nr:hypothetical protein [uncultured Flavobacterium sp.]